jgi:regulator of protease activity HflC (stomatin/prohibitin superfamily)
MHEEKYTEGDARDDIFGIQTKEKDYIKIVSSTGYHIDPNRLIEYAKLFGKEQISSPKISDMLKLRSRYSCESVVKEYDTTAQVMESKHEISAKTAEYFVAEIADLPIIIDYYTVDDLQASDEYESAIEEQAKLRMERAKQELQKEVNEQEAAANKVKAEGVAAVKKIEAENKAEVEKIAAENAAAVKTIEAENAAQVAKIKADNDAEVKRINAEADASVKVTKATADAEATVKAGEAEAKAIEATGNAYKANPELIDLRKTEINAEVQKSWSEKWSGFSFEGLNGINFTNFTDILKGILPGFAN